jgi:cytoskeletal protein RodZ
MTQPNPEQLKDLGLLFTKARVNSGLSIDELSEQLRIPKHYLHAIEAAEEKRLPEPVYVRGFVRKYAQALQLEKDPVIVAFLDQAPPPVIVPDYAKEKSKMIGKPSPVWQWLGYGLAIGGLVVALSATMRTYLPDFAMTPPSPPVEPVVVPPVNKPSPIPPTPSTTDPAPSEPIAEVLPPEATTSPTAPAPEASPTPAPLTGLNLAMAATDNAWMRVVVDGKTQFEGVLPKGTTRQWQGQKNVKVRVGNAGAVILTYNNQLMGPMGSPGKVVDKVFEKK